MRASASHFKINNFIFSFYYIQTEDGFCYIWDEMEANLSVSVFAIMITMFMADNLTFQLGDTTILYSDRCPYQNQNAVISNALVNFAIKNCVTSHTKVQEQGTCK